jgi:sugar phosphate permease
MNTGSLFSNMPTAETDAKKRRLALRYVIILLGLSVFINYIDRGNLSIAAPMLKDELGMTGSQLGILLSAFFWTYGFAQILSGWLVDRFSVSWIMAIGFFPSFARTSSGQAWADRVCLTPY